MTAALLRVPGPLGGQIQGSWKITVLLCIAQSFLYLDLHREVLKSAHKIHLLMTSLVKSDYLFSWNSAAKCLDESVVQRHKIWHL